MVNSTFDNNEVYPFKDNLSLSFSDYFSLKVTEAEIAQHFGYKFRREYLELPVPESNMTEEIAAKAKTTSEAIASILPYVNLDSEIARREIFISPFMYAAIALLAQSAQRRFPPQAVPSTSVCEADQDAKRPRFALAKPQLNIEYYLDVDSQLNGTVDYYLHSSTNQILIVEAKLADIDRGFKQLIPELVAMSKKTEITSFIYGAVTTGSIWCFALLCPVSKEFKRDLNLYLLPNNTRELLEIVIGILLDQNENI